MSETSPNSHLTSGRLLARNTVWNLVGTIAPISVAVSAVPWLIHRIGTDRFGVLTLAWVVVGYFSLFDLGFGRALTKVVAEKLGAGAGEDIPGLYWTSLTLMALFGAVGAGVMAILSPWLVHSVLRIPMAIQSETLRSFYLLAASLPIVIATTAMRGFLEAHQRFSLSTAVRVPLGIFTFAGPLFVVPFTTSLVPIVAVLVAARVGACAASWGLCLQIDPRLASGIALRWGLAGSLFRFGGWMTVSNLVSPLMVYLDRFLIGAVASASAVAYYATPWEAVTKLLMLPAAVVGVLFPAFSTGFAQDHARAKLLFLRGVKYTFLAMFPFVFVVVVFAREGLTLWLGPEFARQSTMVLQWLAVGVLFNGIAQVPFALVQGAGRANFTGKIHLLELPAYLASLWLLVRSRGIDGAAIAWTVRVALDALVLFACSFRLLGARPQKLQPFAVPVGATLVALILGSLSMNLFMKVLLTTLTLCSFGLIAWFALLDPTERVYARGRIRAY